jgi:hypothetical protein
MLVLGALLFASGMYVSRRHRQTGRLGIAWLGCAAFGGCVATVAGLMLCF